MTSRRPGSSSWFLRGAGALALVLIAAALVPAAQSEDTRERMARAAQLAQADRLPDALAELDAAIAAEPNWWEAHYQRGRTLGLMGQLSEAVSSLLRAAELNPGAPHVHQLAAVAAWGAGDSEVAWDQVILAYLSGGDVTSQIQRMAQAGPPPDDFQERVMAPRVYVPELDLTEIETRAEGPFDRNVMARGNTPSPTGLPVNENRSGIPAGILGRELVQETLADLRSVERQFRESIADSRAYGLVVDPELAEYELRIAVDELAERPPRAMSGYLELVARESGVVGYRRHIELADIAAGGVLRGEVELIVDELESWLRKIRAEQDQG